MNLKRWSHAWWGSHAAFSSALRSGLFSKQLFWDLINVSGNISILDMSNVYKKTNWMNSQGKKEVNLSSLKKNLHLSKQRNSQDVEQSKGIMMCQLTGRFFHKVGLTWKTFKMNCPFRCAVIWLLKCTVTARFPFLSSSHLSPFQTAR